VSLTRTAAATLATLALAGLAAPSATAQPSAKPKPKPAKAFDLQAHRGGLGLTTEESPEAFAKALELGVATLELDTQVTRDLKVVVTHDRQVSGVK